MLNVINDYSGSVRLQENKLADVPALLCSVRFPSELENVATRILHLLTHYPSVLHLLPRYASNEGCRSRGKCTDLKGITNAEVTFYASTR